MPDMAANEFFFSSATLVSCCCFVMSYYYYYYFLTPVLNSHGMKTHTHTRLTALLPGLPGWASTRKVKPIWILLKQETVSGSGISWDICKSAPSSRQITMPVPHHSVFYRPDALPATQPTASKHWRHHFQGMKNCTLLLLHIILLLLTLLLLQTIPTGCHALSRMAINTQKINVYKISIKGLRYLKKKARFNAMLWTWSNLVLFGKTI